MIPMANAFVWDECRRSFSNIKGKGFNTKAVYRFFDYSTSSGQYSSSRGECSATNKIDHAKKFFEENYDQLKNDIAKGNGEYLKTFLTYFKCASSQEARYALKENYSDIDSFNLEQSFELSSKLVRINCKY